MSDYKKREQERDFRERDILFSKSIKAGHRIYYFDVKKTFRDDYFFTITESKRSFKDEGGEMPVAVLEKHKIFLYEEDFDKFTDAMQEILDYIRTHKDGISTSDDDE